MEEPKKRISLLEAVNIRVRDYVALAKVDVKKAQVQFERAPSILTAKQLGHVEGVLVGIKQMHDLFEKARSAADQLPLEVPRG